MVPVWSGLAREPDREYVAQRASNYPLPAIYAIYAIAEAQRSGGYG